MFGDGLRVLTIVNLASFTGLGFNMLRWMHKEESKEIENLLLASGVLMVILGVFAAHSVKLFGPSHTIKAATSFAWSMAGILPILAMMLVNVHRSFVPLPPWLKLILLGSLGSIAAMAGASTLWPQAVLYGVLVVLLIVFIGRGIVKQRPVKDARFTIVSTRKWCIGLAGSALASLALLIACVACLDFTPIFFILPCSLVAGVLFGLVVYCWEKSEAVGQNAPHTSCAEGGRNVNAKLNAKLYLFLVDAPWLLAFVSVFLIVLAGYLLKGFNDREVNYLLSGATTFLVFVVFLTDTALTVMLEEPQANEEHVLVNGAAEGCRNGRRMCWPSRWLKNVLNCVFQRKKS